MTGIGHQLPLALDGVPLASFENYVPGANRGVLASLKAMVRADGLDWVYLIGPKASGRTHLLAAVCREVIESGQRSAYLAADALLQYEPAGLQEFARASLVAIDDIEHLTGRADWEEALFHFFNRLRALGGALLVSSTLPAASLHVTLPDLRSRLASGTTLTLTPLDDEQKTALLHRQALARGFALSAEVTKYIMLRVGRDVPRLLQTIDALAQDSLAAQRRITVPFVRTWLQRHGGID